MEEKNYSTGTWNEHILNPKELTQDTVDWIFLVDLLNFSFWSDIDSEDKSKSHPDRYAIKYNGVSYTGYWSLCAAINKALDNGIPITKPSYLQQASDEELTNIFKSDTVEGIPLLSDRIRLMRHAGQVLCQHFNGSFINCIQKANHSAQSLINIILEYFPSFRDIHEFKGRKVYILKRAQILVADIWACFDGKSFGEFNDIDSITMFADYRVPQALYHLNLLEYNTELINKLKNREVLFSGSPEEVEIRGNSIWSVELVRQHIQSLSPRNPVNAILIDFYIWDLAKEIQTDLTIPTHCTRSVYY
ncbi:unnamed protein product [Cunninghamella blakesleeana]